MIKSVIIGCIDYRFQGKIHQTIKSYNLNFGDYDLILIPGGGGNLTECIKYLKMSIKLHNPLNIILIIHEDCQQGATKDDLKISINLIKSIYNNIPIYTEYLKL